MHNTVPLILVGGFGFVGRNIIESVQERDDFSVFAPAVIDDMSNSAPGHEALDLPFYAGSYDEPEAVEFVKGMDRKDRGRIFVFLAGETRVAESKDRPMDFIEANISAPGRFVMSAVEPGDQFILVSTAGALFDGSFEVSVASPYCPKNFYGATKAAEEMILDKLVEMRGASFRVVRLTNVFGRFSEKKQSAIHAFTRASIAGDTVTVNGDGQQSRDFIYASDVGFGIATLARRLLEGEPTEPINMLGSGISTTLMDVIGAIEKAAGKPLAYEQVPATELLKTEPRDVIASERDVRVLLGDSITPFEEGIRQTYMYYSG